MNLFVSDDNGSRYSGKMDDLGFIPVRYQIWKFRHSVIRMETDSMPRELLAGTNPNNQIQMVMEKLT